MMLGQRITTKTLRSFLCFSALLAVGVGEWACSSGAQQSSPGSGANGNAGASSAHGGSATGENGAGASAGQGDGNDAGDGSGADSGTGGSGNSDGGTGSANGGANATGSTTGAGTAGTIGTGTTACDNGKDDDGDGLVDGFDPECTGPFDNDEGTFATGIPGDNSDPKWQDCFFDGNSGAGDDGCRYATGCLTGDLPKTDPDCKLTDACVKFCAPLTQNGCDCFGCCSVQLPNGSSIDVFEASTCSLATIDDAKACPRCVKNTECGNTCGECELCAGKTTLPASCSPPPGTGGSGNTGSGGANTGSGGASATGGSSNAGGKVGSGGTVGTGGVANTCDDGEQVCGPGLAACESGYYCSFGCCIVTVR